MVFIIIAVLAIIFLILWACIDIVPQAEARVIERLGVFHAVWNAGIHVKIPVLDRAVIPHIDLREQVLELPRTYSDGIETTSSFQTQSDSNSTSRSTHTNDYYGAAASTSGSVNNFGVVRASVNAKGNTTLTSKIFGLRENSRFNFNSKVYDSGLSARYSDFRDVITKDNVRMEIDAAVFYQVTDPKQYAYGMKQPLFALQKLTITTLRNIIGTLELDETLCSRDLINTKLRATLDESTDSWGIKITRVEIESILPPHRFRKLWRHRQKPSVRREQIFSKLKAISSPQFSRLKVTSRQRSMPQKPKSKELFWRHRLPNKLQSLLQGAKPKLCWR